MTLRNMVEEIGHRLNTALSLDGAGLARILVDDSLAVDFELDESSSRLLIYAVIGILPAGPAREAFFENLLAANLFGADTGSCSPAFDRERNELLLWFALAEETHIETVMTWLENLVTQAEYWRPQLADAQANRATTVSPRSGAPAGIDSFVRA